MTQEQATQRTRSAKAETSLQLGDAPFSEDSIRCALKWLHNPQKLGNHPLAQLDFVSRRFVDKGYKDDAFGRGAALRDVLCEAIESLKPDEAESDALSRSWQPYLILSKQYVKRYSPVSLARQMNVGRSTYFREQKRSFSLLAAALQKQEQANLAGNRQSIFMAPPHPPYSLVGRDVLLGDLKRRLFAGGGVAFSAIDGLPGVGKTALAVELAYDPEVLAHFEDGILWVSLSRKPDVFALLGGWGVALGIQPHEMAKLTTIEERARAVHLVIGVRRMLLVIDDAWQAEAALTFKLGGPNCAHLLTTRIPEISLSFTDDGVISVPELSEGDSITLLDRLAPQVVADEPDEALKLARTVGGLPLALTLIGWHLRKATRGGHPRRLRYALEQLRQAEVRLQISQPQGWPPRRFDAPNGVSLSLQMVIGLSDETLEPTARRALRALAVFPPKPNTFMEEAALAVADVPVETLDALADYSLLESSGPGRYTLHQTIADYAGLELAKNAAACRRAYERMVAFFVRYLETQKDHVAIERESQNILAAFQAAFDQGMWVELVRGVGEFYGFLETIGLYRVAETLLGQAEEAARRSADMVALTTILRRRGVVARYLNRWEQAQIYLQEGLALARSLQDHRAVVATLESLGKVAFDQGRYAGAETFYREGLALAREIDDHERCISLLECLGWVENGRGNYAQLEEYLTQSLALARNVGNREKIYLLLGSLGLAALDQGKWNRAETYLQEGLALARQSGDRLNSIVLLVFLSFVKLGYSADIGEASSLLIEENLALLQDLEYSEKIQLYLSDLTDRYLDCLSIDPLVFGTNLQRTLALSHRTRYPARVHALGVFTIPPLWQRSISVWEMITLDILALMREIGQRDQACILLSGLGRVAGSRGDLAQAEVYLAEGLALARQGANRRQVGALLLDLGAVVLNREDLTRAEVYLQEGLRLAREIRDQVRVIASLNCLGVAAVGRKDYAQAEVYLREGVVSSREIEFRYGTYVSLANLAAVALQCGHLDLAEECLQEGLVFIQGKELGCHSTSLFIGWGDLCLERGQVDAAALAFYQAGEEGTNAKIPQEWTALALYGLAHTALVKGDVAEARRLGQESRDMFRAVGFYRADEVAEWLEILCK